MSVGLSTIGRAAMVDYAWGGTLDFAFDLMPHLGQMDGLWYALGYAGHGVALASWMGATHGAAAVGARVWRGKPIRGVAVPPRTLGVV